MAIRARSASDIVACVGLLRLTHEADRYPPFWPDPPERFLLSDAELGAWVVDGEGGILGHVALHDADGDLAFRCAHEATGLPAAGLGVVARLMVAPTARRQGLARRLLDHAVAACHAQGRRPALDTVSFNEPAITLYERMGWKQVGVEPVATPTGSTLDLVVFIGPESGS